MRKNQKVCLDVLGVIALGIRARMNENSSDENPQYSITVGNIANRFGYTKKEVFKAIKTLIKQGFLVLDREANGDVFFLNCEKMFQTGSKK